MNCLQVTNGKLYTGSDDGTIKIWDLFHEMSTPSQVLDLQQQGVFCLQAQGPLLVCGLENKYVAIQAPTSIWPLHFECFNSIMFIILQAFRDI